MKKLSERVLYRGRWLTLKEAVFEAEDGRRSIWESIEKSRDPLTVIAVAKMLPSNRYILIRQYRAAIEGYVIGFPAGISNESEDRIPEEALRELKEETGYSGRVLSRGPALKQSSGIMNERVYVVFIEVDETLPENQNPQQALEAGEEIEVLIKSADEIPAFLDQMSASGTAIGAGVWYFFMGIQARGRVSGTPR